MLLTIPRTLPAWVSCKKMMPAVVATGHEMAFMRKSAQLTKRCAVTHTVSCGGKERKGFAAVDAAWEIKYNIPKTHRDLPSGSGNFKRTNAV